MLACVWIYFMRFNGFVCFGDSQCMTKLFNLNACLINQGTIEFTL